MGRTSVAGGEQYEEVQAEGEKPKFPVAIRYILGNEFCERFSYYGLRAVLALYLRKFWTVQSYDEKQKRDDRVTALLHSWIVLCYMSPLLGGYISDAHWGKYKTIFLLSIVYCIGNVVNAATAIPGFGGPGGSNESLAGACVGLLLIALGTGGIKPCVAAFGGDQFDPTNPLLAVFFSLFYFSINSGSVISTIVTPILREDVSCFGQDECYSLAFGVPAVLMIIALILFVAGTKHYRIVPPQGSMLSTVLGVIKLARKRSDSPEHSDARHWVDRAVGRGDGVDGYTAQEAADVKSLLGVLYMFLPVPIFWTLFDQTASRWTLMAVEMDGCITGSEYTLTNETPTGEASWKKSCDSFELLADQMQVLNSAFILILIPVFSKGVYRLFPMRPLTKMAIGMIFSAAAFALAAGVQFSVTDGNIGISTSNGTLLPGKSFQYDHGCIEDDDYIMSVHDCTENVDLCADCEMCVHGCTSILWQIPMYFLLTCGEVMVSITGLEFAYAEAPPSMKSVCQAAWLLTIAVGNIVVIIVAGSNMFTGDDGVAYELIFYSCLMIATMLLFACMSRGYKYKSALLGSETGSSSPNRGSELSEEAARLFSEGKVDLPGKTMPNP